MRRWVVSLIKPPTKGAYRGDFFPRGFTYKANALVLQAEVKRNGGEAEVKRSDTNERLDK